MTKEENRKDIILELGRVRIIRKDVNNLEVQREETYTTVKDKQKVKDYRFKGYYGDVFKALKGIAQNNLITSKRDKTSLTEHLDEVKKTKEEIFKYIDEKEEELRKEVLEEAKEKAKEELREEDRKKRKKK